MLLLLLLLLPLDTAPLDGFSRAMARLGGPDPWIPQSRSHWTHVLLRIMPKPSVKETRSTIR